MAEMLQQRPIADALTVEDLVLKVMGGMIRVPGFQRAFKWKAKDVGTLLDSVWRGFPIGSLLFWERKEPVARLALGPLTLEVPALSNAWSVVDGQQRITALAGALRHPALHAGARDQFAWYFDLDQAKFVQAGGRIATGAWLPVNKIIDTVELLRWVDERRPALTTPQKNLAFALSKAMREYKLPYYLVSEDNEQVLRQIFERLNASGMPLTAPEVFDALRGGDTNPPGTLRALADDLAGLRFGLLTPETLLTVLAAVKGLNITVSAQRLAREQSLLGAIPIAREALRATVVFLKNVARIPHLLVLPYRFPLFVLARFFSRFPQPIPRTQELLSRWVWRGALTGLHANESRALVREQMKAVGSGDEEDATQALLAFVKVAESNARPPEAALGSVQWKRAVTRLEIVALLSLRPRDLLTDALVEADELFEREGQAGLGRVLRRPAPTLEGAIDLSSTLANRLVHRPLPGGQFKELLLRGSPSVLESHGIAEDARELLRAGDESAFLRARAAVLRTRFHSLFSARAGWSQSDRPSLGHLMKAQDDSVRGTG
jgi:hypothetical protein